MKKLACFALAFCLLAGLCACGQGVAEETTVEVTTAEVTTEEVTVGQLGHSVTLCIHDSLPAFDFHLRGYDNSEFLKISTIVIYGGIHQQLAANFEIESWARDRLEMIFDDFNNDGFLDLRLQAIYNRNGPSIFFLWDNDKQEFVENEQLAEINIGRYPLGVGEDGRIHHSAQKWESDTYEYIDGVFVHVGREESHYLERKEINGVSYHLEKRYKRIDGEMVLVSSTWEKD